LPTGVSPTKTAERCLDALNTLVPIRHSRPRMPRLPRYIRGSKPWMALSFRGLFSDSVSDPHVHGSSTGAPRPSADDRRPHHSTANFTSPPRRCAECPARCANG
jgi:hypothetical protein